MAVSMVERITHNLTYGFKCKTCNKGKMREFGYYTASGFTSVTYRCALCGEIRTEIYPTKKFKEAKENADSR